MPDPINQSDSEAIVKTKIQEILTFNSITSTGISSWGVARARLNSAATYLGLPIFDNKEAGSSVRAKINAIAASPASSIPANTALPIISGNTVSGQTLTATNGSWTGYPTTFTFSYQWKSDGVDILGQTGQTLLLTDDYAGKSISISVSATNSRGTSSLVTSGPTSSIAPSWLPANFNFYADFKTTNRYWNENITSLNSIITDIHPQSIIVQSENGNWTEAAENVISQSDLGLQVIPTRTNGIRNNTRTGAVVGSPGTGPNHWTTGSLAGLSREVVGLGFENGLPYIDLRFSGTTTTSGPITYSTDTVALPVTTGQTVTASVYCKLIAAPAPANAYGFRVTEVDSSNTALANRDSTNAINPNSTLRLFQSQFTMQNPTVAGARLIFRWSITNGSSYDFTVRLATPQLELGNYATPPILTTSAQITRAGNIVTNTLPNSAKMGIGGFIKLNQIGIDPLDLPVILGFNPSTKVAQSLLEAAFDLGTVAPAVRTIVFAASPGYTKVRLYGGADTTSIAGDFDDDITTMSFGGNGFDTLNNLYAVYDKIGLRFGVMNDTIFNQIYELAA